MTQNDIASMTKIIIAHIIMKNVPRQSFRQDFE